MLLTQKKIVKIPVGLLSPHYNISPGDHFTLPELAPVVGLTSSFLTSNLFSPYSVMPQTLFFPNWLLIPFELQLRCPQKGHWLKYTVHLSSYLAVTFWHIYFFTVTHSLHHIFKLKSRARSFIWVCHSLFRTRILEPSSVAFLQPPADRNMNRH